MAQMIRVKSHGQVHETTQNLKNVDFLTEKEVALSRDDSVFQKFAKTVKMSLAHVTGKNLVF